MSCNLCRTRTVFLAVFPEGAGAAEEGRRGNTRGASASLVRLETVVWLRTASRGGCPAQAGLGLRERGNHVPVNATDHKSTTSAWTPAVIVSLLFARDCCLKTRSPGLKVGCRVSGATLRVSFSLYFVPCAVKFRSPIEQPK
jgi:hypothetical protein